MWIKICGIRDEQTAEQVCQLLPDAIGLNFYRKSPRFVSADMARRITEQFVGRVQSVGVFVNHDPGEVEDIASECRLSAIQLHGDETVAQIANIAERMPGIPIYRAWRMAGESLQDLADHLAECQESGVHLAGCLIDSRVSGSYGGTGHTVPWKSLAREYRNLDWPPLILAGGLVPSNVVEAMAQVQPWGVDVASGVESAPGIKDLERVRLFIRNART